jgi:hypothetical protein
MWTLHGAERVSLEPKLFDLGLEDPEREREVYDKEGKVAVGRRGWGAECSYAVLWKCVLGLVGGKRARDSR